MGRDVCAFRFAGFVPRLGFNKCHISCQLVFVHMCLNVIRDCGV